MSTSGSFDSLRSGAHRANASGPRLQQMAYTEEQDRDTQPKALPTPQRLEDEINLLIALNAGHFATWSFDITANRFELSAKAARIFGLHDACKNWTLDQFLGFFQQENRHAIASLFHSVHSRDQEIEFEVPVLSKESERWIWVHGQTIETDRGQYKFIGLITDITERKLALSALEKSEYRFRRLVETANVGIKIEDLDGNITYMNPCLRQLLGYTEEEVEQGLARWDQMTPPEYVDADRKAVQEIRLTGTSIAYEKVYHAKSGRDIPVLVGASNISSNDKGKEEIATFVIDLTLQKETEAKLEQSRWDLQQQWAELETIYQTAPVGLALFSVDGFRYLRVNDTQAAVIGRPVDAIVGRYFQDIAPALAPKILPLFEQVLQGIAIRNYEVEGELPSQPGIHRYWTVSYSPVFDQAKRVQAISAVVFETTAHKRAEQALIQSEKLAAVGRLASSISHEINNPLEAVTNLIYIAASLPGLPREAQHILALADKELARVSQIASQTLRFHRQSTKPTLITPLELLRPLLAVYRSRLSNAGISLREFHEEAAAVTCFENDIRQAVSNLLSNALDATKRGGEIHVRSRNATDWKTGRRGVRITIADTGTGMPQEVKEQLFEAFFTTKGIQGTGLGLWISKGIIDKHRGALRFYSSNRTQITGSVFSLFLPGEAINPPKP